MTPYNEGAKVIIDPTVPPNHLLFGTVTKDMYDELGTIKEKQYLHPKKCTIYKVYFHEANSTMWFKESELVLVAS